MAGHIEVVKVLLDGGASIDAIADNKWTVLHLAARDDHIDVAVSQEVPTRLSQERKY